MKSLIQIYQKNREENKQKYPLVFENYEKRRFYGEELRVLKEIINQEYSSGKNYKEIGELLNLDHSTIAFHRKKFLKESFTNNLKKIKK